jgi:CelD/BcsL family acetyltransferase involved in cellulose biosynthesis
MASLEWITEQSRFAAIASEWDALASVERTPFLTFAWLDAWYRAFAADRGLLVTALWRDGRLVGGLPLLTSWRRWAGAANGHSPAFGLLAADPEARTQLVEAVVRNSATLIVPKLAEDDPTLAMLMTAARRERRWTSVESHAALIVDTGGSVEKYRAAMSAKTRSELGRLQRKAEREHALELRPLGEVVDLDGQLARALTLEASGWKGRAGTAISCSPDTERFYWHIARAFHAAGALRISELSLDGELTAVALSIVHRTRVFTLKVGYDEHHRRLAPGLLLLRAMIERCVELGLEAYEFSGPEEEYERRFATAQRAYHLVQVARRNPLGLARHTYRQHLRSPLRAAYISARRAGMPDLRTIKRAARDAT